MSALTAGAAGANGEGPPTGAAELDRDEARDLLRRAIVGILTEIDPADPAARAYRRRLSAALG